MKCVSCGNDQESGKFCDRCGRMITRIMREKPGHSHEGDGDEVRPAELKCRCGHVQKSGRFCDACGVMLSFYRAQPDDDVMTKRCPACGGRSSKPVCRNCGVKIPGFPEQED